MAATPDTFVRNVVDHVINTMIRDGLVNNQAKFYEAVKATLHHQNIRWIEPEEATYLLEFAFGGKGESDLVLYLGVFHGVDHEIELCLEPTEPDDHSISSRAWEIARYDSRTDCISYHDSPFPISYYNNRLLVRRSWYCGT